MQRCPTCNRSYTDDVQGFCPSDGTPLVRDARTIKRCPTCNQTYDETAPNFCPRDGTPLLIETQPPVAPPPYGGAPQPPPPGVYNPPPPPSFMNPGYNPYAGQGAGAPGYGQQPYGMQPGVFGGPPGAGGRLLAIGEKREPGMVLLFTFLTCGIYAIWWYHKYATEIKNALGRQDLNPGTDLLLTFVTCGIWGIIAFYSKYPKLITDMEMRVGMPPNDISSTTILLGILFAPAAIYIIQSELNKVWDVAARMR
jgi:Domain of unknown function (DUF4234)